MKIICETRMYPDEILKMLEQKSKVALDYAAHFFSSAIYKGFYENHYSVNLINIPNVGSFPLLNKLVRMPSLEFLSGKNIPFWNFLYLKRRSILRNEFRHLSKLLKRGNGEGYVFLLYNFKDNRFLERVKQKWPLLKICMLVTDLPEYMDATDKYRFFKRLLPKSKTADGYCFPQVDGYIFLAPKMSERIVLNGKPWMIMEGIFSPEKDEIESEKGNYKTIVYTGNLNARYGILDLIEAFTKISGEEYKLRICGTGDSVDTIKSIALNDKRIEYLGLLPRQKVLEIQKSATLLVNPRHASEPYTKYSFPSKTMEYLASGTPVLMHHLESIPSDYNSHIYYLEDEDVDTMAETIMDICSKPRAELEVFGKEAASFIYEHKTAKSQLKRVVDFMETL